MALACITLIQSFIIVPVEAYIAIYDDLRHYY